MDKTKIILGVSVSLAVFSAYWFITRNREPYLDLDGTDWSNNIAEIKFGRNKKSVSLGNSGEMNAGSTYSDKYKLTFESSGKNMILYIKDKYENIYDKKVIDFGAKIIY
jgi:hypothetical protein